MYNIKNITNNEIQGIIPYKYKYYTLTNEFTEIPYNHLVIAKDNAFKEGLKKYTIISSNIVNTSLNSNNDNIYEVLDASNDIYYKLPIDIDGITSLDDNKDYIDVVEVFIMDLIEFFKNHFNIVIEQSQILISSSNGIKNNKKKISYHCIVPVIFKWVNITTITNLLNENLYLPFNILNAPTIKIDNSIIKRIQCFRCLYQSKIGEKRYNIPLKIAGFNYSEDAYEHLIGVYNKDDIHHFQIIDDNLTNITDNIIKKEAKVITNFKKTENFKSYKYNDLSKLDKISMYLFCITNDLSIIDRREWFKLISYVVGYTLTATRDDVNDNNSISSNVDYDTLEEYYIAICLEWTILAYQNNVKHTINKLSIIQLKQQAKEENITGYSIKILS